MKSLEKVRAAGEVLQHSGIEHPLREAELIVAHCLGISRMILYRDNPEIGQDALVLIDASVMRRSQREPLQYILGYAEFLGLTIRVGPGVLIPRPETELLVDEAVRLIAKHETDVSHLAILDICTGSGCIALRTKPHPARLPAHAALLPLPPYVSLHSSHRTTQSRWLPAP